MAAALSFINFGVNGGLLGLTAAQLAKQPEQDDLFTNVQITVGTGISATAGNTPTVAIWDKYGQRVGQSKNTEHIGSTHKKYDAAKAKQVTVKEKEVIPLSIKNDQMQNIGQVNPAYLFLAAWENDAPCVAAVSASGNGVTWNWFGDIAVQCPGTQWYNSDKIVGDGVYRPKCVWLDRDYSKGIWNRGLSLHMQDFSATEARKEQYTKYPDTLCKSAKRMTFWHDVEPDFDLPGNLELFPADYDRNGYNDDYTDKDFAKVIDNKAHFGPPATSKGKVRKSRRSDNSTNSASNTIGKGHLVISDHEQHSAQELCESPSSLGPDFVSTEESLFCDMSSKTIWHLCSTIIKTMCFDLQAQKLVGGTQNVTTRDLETDRALPEKEYDTYTHWKPDAAPIQQNLTRSWY
ncbi:MAG: hypothetical protein M1836_001300 [Candelina mexicana]|nr:MAG: hypothetical protein M1836_001300 [Candelina mexicana]